MASGEIPVENIHDENTGHRTAAGRGAAWVAVLISLTLSVMLAATTIHDITSRGPHGAADWIRMGLAVAMVAVLTTLALMRRHFAGANSGDAAGEATMALFELDFDAPGAATVAQRGASRRKVSIGSVARSIRQHTSDISEVATRLANAYGADSGEPGSEQGRLRRITEAQASALAQLDTIRQEAHHTADEISGYREKLAAMESIARMQVEHIGQHVAQLQTMATDAGTLSRAAGTLQAIHQAAVNSQMAAQRHSLDTASGLRQLVGEMEKALLAFRSAGSAAGLATNANNIPMPANPAHGSQDTAATLVETMEGMARKAETLESLLSALADTVKLLQVNLNFAATADSIFSSNSHMAGAPRMIEQESASLADAASTLAAARDVAAGLGQAVARSMKTTNRTFDAWTKREGEWRSSIDTLTRQNAALSGMAGDLARTIGEVRFATLNMISQLDPAAKNMSASLVNTDNVAVMQEIHDAVDHTILASQRIAAVAVHLIAAGETINRNAVRSQANTQELRMLASSTAGNGQRLQHASSTAVAKVEGLVALTRGLVRKEDGAARRATANTARFTIQQKTQLIDEFALRVLAMEESARMSRGPSPAVERDEQMAKVPQFELPVQ